MAGISSYFNMILAVMFLCLTASTQALTPCANSEKLPGGCKCFKNPARSNEAMLECKNIDSDKLIHSFATLYANGDTFYEIIIEDSDLSATTGLPEDLQYSLKSLKLSGVTGLAPDTISSLISPLDKLNELVLRNCNLRHVRKNFFGEKPELIFIDLDENQIEDIEDGTFELFPKLQILSLDRNKLTKVPLAALTVPELKTLELFDNKISGFSPAEVEMFRQKDGNNFMLHIDTLDCSCEAKESPIVKWVQERRMQTVSCSYPEALSGSQVSSMTDDQFCNGAPLLTVSLWLLLGLCLLICL